jgi:hypothetical protein
MLQLRRAKLCYQGNNGSTGTAQTAYLHSYNLEIIANLFKIEVVQDIVCS